MLLPMSGTFQFIAASLSSEQLRAFLTNQLTVIDQRRVAHEQSLRDSIAQHQGDELAEIEALKANPLDVLPGHIAEMERDHAARFSKASVEAAVSSLQSPYEKARFRIQTALDFLPSDALFELSHDELLGYTADQLLAEDSGFAMKAARRLSIPRVEYAKKMVGSADR